MNTVLASIDGSSASVGVLEVGGAIAELVDGALEVLHVDVGASLRALFHTQGLNASLTIAHGDAVGAILRASARDDVSFLVLALRDRVLSPAPIGTTTRAILSCVTKPTIVVPPLLAPWPDHDQMRVLVPVPDGAAAPLNGTVAALGRLREAGSEMILARLDGPAVDASTPVPAGSMSLRVSIPRNASAAILAAAAETQADLIAIARSDRPTDMNTVWSTIACATTPVLLLTDATPDSVIAPDFGI